MSEIETEAMQPDASLSHFTSFGELSPEDSLDPQLEIHLKSLGVHEVYLQQRQQQPRNDDLSVVGFVQLRLKNQSLHKV